ncbi:MAG: ABC transporter ATP-binding protein [Parcubacteria group bacterium]|nr:ABC transporter ATP-binding protein [Parcubacteria group bacterium]
MFTLENVSKEYRTGSVSQWALSDISLSVGDGEFVAITGPSGSGKSTLMHLMGGLDRPTHGVVRVDGEDVNDLSDQALAAMRNKKIGFVFQAFHLLPALSVFENVRLPLIYAHARSRSERDEVRTVLEHVGLEQKIDRKIRELSGGEQQRVAIARALINDPKAILADEPTGNLDSKNGREILHILSSLYEAGKTIVLVTHNAILARASLRQIRIEDGRIV